MRAGVSPIARADAGRGEPIARADAGRGGPTRAPSPSARRSLLRKPSCAALGAHITQLRRPDATVRGVSPVLLQMWIGPVPGSEMQAALTPVVATMRVWASPALLQMLAGWCQVPGADVRRGDLVSAQMWAETSQVGQRGRADESGHSAEAGRG